MAESGKHAGAILTIDLDAICHNYRLLRKQARGAACAAVLKADAYGLGAARVAQALAAQGCRQFFVAHLDEGIALRPHVPEDAEIFVLHGPPVHSEMEFIRHGLIPVLNSVPQVAGWRRAARDMNCVLPAIVQIDSGMSRLGLSSAEVNEWHDDPAFLRGIDLRYLMSHLACAERQDHQMNRQQLDVFNETRKRLPSCRASFANSSAIFLGSDFHFDLVRPGAALYGVAPVTGAENPMQPVVRLEAKIIQTRTIERGDRVGYGATFRAEKQCRIATVSVGYADGWLRGFSNRGCALVDGVRAPIVGIVSMDTCTLDVSDIEPSRLLPGAVVDLISAQQTVDEVAGLAGTIAYEILTSLGTRYYRNYVGGRISDTQSDNASLAAA